MQIRQANIQDCLSIKQIYLQAFDNWEAELISNFAFNLLQEKTTVDILSLVAIDNNLIIGHIAFSPVFLASTNEHLGYILAPLAVLPTHQKKGVGSTIVKHGLETISSLGAFMVFVYGDPQYYSRFGFKTDLAQNYTAPYALKYPEGWQAMKLNSIVFPQSGKIKCVSCLNDPKLW